MAAQVTYVYEKMYNTCMRHIHHVQTDARTAMKNAKAKYQFMGQDLARVSVIFDVLYTHNRNWVLQSTAHTIAVPAR